MTDKKDNINSDKDETLENKENDVTSEVEADLETDDKAVSDVKENDEDIDDDDDLIVPERKKRKPLNIWLLLFWLLFILCPQIMRKILNL
jgi:hypothetical protein